MTAERRVGRGRRAVAFLLSLVQPGAGHVLVGRFWAAAAWVAALAGAVVVLVFALPPSSVTFLAALIVTVVGRLIVAVDSARGGGERPRWVMVLLGWGALVLVNLGQERVAAYYRDHHVQTFTIPSRSMADALLQGDYIIVDKAAYRAESPRRGDIVVFTHPVNDRRTFIYRIVGTPGELLQVRGQRVVINGRLLTEPYLRDPSPPGAGEACGYDYGCEPLVLPPDSYFVMGDNREHAQDSRYWGAVRRERIRGRAVEVYWSWDSDRHWLRWSRIGHRIR